MKNQNEDMGVILKNQYVIWRILLSNCYVFFRKPELNFIEMFLYTGRLSMMEV